MAQPRGHDDLIARAQGRIDASRNAALGGLQVAAQRRDADHERAIRLAADTLLDKASRRLGEGDAAAARRLVDRALQLGLPGSEPGEEGSLAVHLFVWDALRETALDGEHEVWLDRAEEADRALDGVARRAWRAALRSLLDEGELPPPDRRRLRALVAGSPADRDPFEGVAHADRVDATLRLLEGVRAVAG